MMSIPCESIAIFVADGAPLAEVTTWLYDEASGALTNKVYADGMGPTYDYTPNGRLSRRTWARGIVCDYAYDGWGNLTNVEYATASGIPPLDIPQPNAWYTYDAMGRMASAVVEGVSTNLYFHSAYGELTNEVQNGVSIARNYDAFGRPSGYTLCDSVPLCEVNYSYDALGRFAAVDFNAEAQSGRVEYGYLPGTDFVTGYTSCDFSRSVTYEPHRDLIAAVTNVFGSTLISAFDYANDAAGRRVSRIDTFGGATTTNTFGYNIRSEVTSAAMGTNSYGYAYDPIGNRRTASHNDETTTYTANNLNQYSAVTSPLSPLPSHLSYDADGNMTADERGWHYAWNGENRMVCASNDEVVVSYAYDHRGRMVQKNISHGDTETQRIEYLWDAWNIVRETLVTPTSTNVTHNVWGLDLDGSLQGAGGVGGLLSVVRGGEAFLPTYDANGNVGEYVNSFNGSIIAHYDYSSFGEPIVVFGELASTFTHQFSTKPLCDITGLNEYVYRKFHPVIGRWLNRDPFEELRRPKVVLRRQYPYEKVFSTESTGTLNGQHDIGRVRNTHYANMVKPSFYEYESNNAYSFVENNPLDATDNLGLLAQWLAGCTVGACFGAIGGGLGGISRGLRGVACGAASGAITGCATGAICSMGEPTLCIKGSCIAGFLGTIGNNLCMQGSDSLKDPCAWISAIVNSTLGCLGGVADQGEMKRKIISWVLGVDVSVWSNLCGD